MEFFKDFGLYFACMSAGFLIGITYAYSEYDKWAHKQIINNENINTKIT
tara:strand:- start:53 stop:199 length:147 start_codon:yes stop_codon:yes gene_type:complete